MLLWGIAKIVSVDIHHNTTINKESMKVVSKCSPLVLQEIHTKTDQEAQLLQRHCTSTPCQWKYSRLLRNGRKMPSRKLQISKTLSRSLVLVPIVPSVLWHCWLSGRKGNRPVKNWVVGCWRGYLSGAICRLHMAQLMPLSLTFWYQLTWVVPDKGPLTGVCVVLVPIDRTYNFLLVFPDNYISIFYHLSDITTYFPQNFKRSYIGMLKPFIFRNR